MKLVNETAVDESIRLAREKGAFPNWKGSEYEKRGVKRRNLAVTTIAPTGTISMVVDCSSGIEPAFGLSFVKNVVDEDGLSYVNPYFKKAIERLNLTSEQKSQVYRRVMQTGSCQDIEYLPDSIKQLFVTAYDISPEWHVKMQAAFQKQTENAVSKTINFPQKATISDVEKAYLLAWELGCKGITVYRSGSKEGQILEAQSAKRKAKKKNQSVQSKMRIKPLRQKITENNGEGCPECGRKMEMGEGCMTCRNCGFSKCST
jgi:ribonucleoside-diphosphate reductase alpha chain